MTTKTKEEVIIELAKDVIQQIKKEKYIADHNWYRIETANQYDYLSGSIYDESLQEILKNKAKKCSVCAIGSLFISYVRNYNEINTRDIRNSSDQFNIIYNKLKQFFNIRQLQLIEFTYEGGEGRWDSYQLEEEYDFSTEEIKIAFQFHRKYTDKDRLLAIMRNIVRNKGIFVLHKKGRKLKAS